MVEEKQPAAASRQAPQRPIRRWPIRKALTIVVLACLIFGAGVEVGKGKLQLSGLNQPVTQKAPAQLDYSSVNQVYGVLKKDFDGNLDATKLTDGLKAGLVSAAGDPYTEYLNPQDAKALDEVLSGSFTGIGAELGSDANSNIVIVSPLAG